ncbi:hypothetical protein GCM10007989_37080 [Devosia pacifica]|uniref:PRC-barrel domain-containing protein n=1 Tax=Devosia pacifica TaxID=1335967 RepID=A0A918SEN6_9HYPH|nr:hypothetical protein [Devosia pacifica]GHA37786.1 hypothetical protein GCM10007989_37080 [Devosia pacifica]
MESLPKDIRNGMKVYDSEDHEIGTVEDYQFSDEDPNQPGPETSAASVDQREPDTLINTLGRAFAPTDQLSSEVQERLMREGFIRLDADGLFAADRYITPDQIGSVTGDRVVLNVKKSDLMKAE